MQYKLRVSPTPCLDLFLRARLSHLLARGNISANTLQISKTVIRFENTAKNTAARGLLIYTSVRIRHAISYIFDNSIGALNYVDCTRGAYLRNLLLLYHATIMRTIYYYNTSCFGQFNTSQCTCCSRRLRRD